MRSTPNKLYLYLPASLSHGKHPAVKVVVPQVKRLALAGKSQVSAFFQHQNAPVTFYLRDRSKLTVNGIVNVQRLTQYDQSHSTIVFTNSHDLQINLAQLSFAYIAGQAQHLRASTRDDAVLSETLAQPSQLAEKQPALWHQPKPTELYQCFRHSARANILAHHS